MMELLVSICEVNPYASPGLRACNFIVVRYLSDGFSKALLLIFAMGLIEPAL